MTEKKAQILQAALRLFAQQGYDATPTSQIAREAGVSEGGMFRHFPSKEALMLAVLELGHEQVSRHVESILPEKEPTRLLHSIIDLPQLLLEKEPEFWRVQLSLKWQGKLKGRWKEPTYNAALFEVAVKAFAQLGFDHPIAEAKLLFVTLEGWSNVLVAMLTNPEATVDTSLIDLLKSKYVTVDGER